MNRETHYEVLIIDDVDNDAICYEVECWAIVDTQEPYKGTPWTCDSDMDYYGYSDLVDSGIESINAIAVEGGETLYVEPSEKMMNIITEALDEWAQDIE